MRPGRRGLPCWSTSAVRSTKKQMDDRPVHSRYAGCIELEHKNLKALNTSNLVICVTT
nr:MAG TPA: hypothetical protein [Caudoviricetes sp.]